MKRNFTKILAMVMTLIFVVSLMSVNVVTATESSYVLGATAATIEAENLEGQTVGTEYGTNNAAGSTYSGTGYITASGAGPLTVEIPVQVEKAGTYEIDMHGFVAGNGVQIIAGTETVALAYDLKTHFQALQGTYNRNVLSYTGKITLNTDVTVITINVPDRANMTENLVVDCITFTCTESSYVLGDTAATIEAEDLEGQTVVTAYGSKNAEGSTYSGTGYITASGAGPLTVEIPVQVEKAGTYEIDMHGFVAGNGVQIIAGTETVALEYFLKTHFHALQGSTDRSVISYTGKITLNTDVTVITINVPDRANMTENLVVDCIKVKCVELENNTGDGDNIGDDNNSAPTLSSDGTTTVIEAENLSFANGGIYENYDETSSSVPSNGKYFYHQEATNGAKTITYNIPINVVVNGVYEVDVHVYRSGTGPLKICDVELEFGTEILFRGKPTATSRGVQSATGEVNLTTDMTSVNLTFNYTGTSKATILIDCIEFTLIEKGITTDGSVMRTEAEELNLGSVETSKESGTVSGTGYVVGSTNGGNILVPVTIVKDGFYEISFGGYFPEETYVSGNDYYKQQLLEDDERLFSVTQNGQLIYAKNYSSILYLSEGTSVIQIDINLSSLYILDYMDLKYVDDNTENLVLKNIDFVKYDGSQSASNISSATDKIRLEFNDVQNAELLKEYIKIKSIKDGTYVEITVECEAGICEVNLINMLVPNTYYELWIDEEICGSEIFARKFSVNKVFKTENDGMFIVNNISIKNNGAELDMNSLSNEDSLALKVEFIKTTDMESKYTLFYFAYEEDSVNNTTKLIKASYLPISITADNRGRIEYTLNVSVDNIDDVTKIKGALWSYPDNVSVARCEY